MGNTGLEGREGLDPQNEASLDGESGFPAVTSVSTDVQERVANVIELSPEGIAFIAKLRERYESDQHDIVCHSTMPWDSVEAKLKANPAKLQALMKMDASGGEPDMVEVAEGGELIFVELAENMPKSRVASYDEAEARVAAMGGGAEFVSGALYGKLWVEREIKMDTKSGSFVWVKGRKYRDASGSLVALAACQREEAGKIYVLITPHYPDEPSNVTFRCCISI